MLVRCDPAQALPSAPSLRFPERYLATATDLYRQVKPALWHLEGSAAATVKGARGHVRGAAAEARP